MRYEEVIAEQMKQRQIQNGKNQKENLKNVGSGSNGHIPTEEPKLLNPTSKRKELAKIAAGTSEE